MTGFEQRARQLLAEASVIAEASASKPDPSPVHSSKTLSRPPSIAGESTYDELRRRFARCERYGGWEEAVKWAEGEMTLIRKGLDRRPETPKRFRARLNFEYEGVHYEDVARRENCSVAYVRKIRVEADRDPLRGRLRKAAA